jgi:uncharacterized protein YcbK (DUF882 family)
VKAAVVALALLVPALARADSAATIDAAKPAPLSKKDQYWAAKQQAAKPLRKTNRVKLVGKKPQPVVNIFNTWTHEWIAVERNAKAVPDPLVDRFLRCHFTNEPADMDGRLASVLLEAARHFGATRVNIVSGFRAPKYNLMLRKKGRRVAKDSEHTKGHAVDFWLPGVSTEQLYNWALGHQLGGVGKYLSDGFVHVDVGRKRTWVDP